MKLIIWSPSPSFENFKKSFKKAISHFFSKKDLNQRFIIDFQNLIKDIVFYFKSSFFEILINLKYGLPMKYIEFKRRYRSNEHESNLNDGNEDFFTVVLDILKTKSNINGNIGALNKTLIEGNPVLLIANHPYVPIDSFMLMSMVLNYRSDCQIMANIKALKRLKTEYNKYVIPIQLSGGLLGSRDADFIKKSGLNALRKSINSLESGKCLIIFPSGQGSKAKKWGEEITDLEWLGGVGYIVKFFAEAKKQLTVLPVFVEGHMGSLENSKVFQKAVIDYPYKLSAALQYCLFNAPPTVNFKIGTELKAEDFTGMSGNEITNKLRHSVYLMADEIRIAERS